MKLRRRGPGLYIYDGTRGRYKVASCPMPRIGKRGSGGKTGWEVYVPGCGEDGVKVRNLDQARAVIADHEQELESSLP